MIEKLISDDLAVLARAHRRVPPIETLLPRPREKAARTPVKWQRWIGLVVTSGSVVFAVKSGMFDEQPMSAPIIAIAILSLLGMLRSTVVRESFGQQLGMICAAIGVVGVAAVMFLADRFSFPRFSSNFEGVFARFGPEDERAASEVVQYASIAIAIGYLVGRIAGVVLAPRRWQLASAIAKIAMATVVLTWIGVCRFESYDVILVPFHNKPLDYAFRIEVTRAIHDIGWANPVEAHLSRTQFDLLAVAVGIGILLLSIAVAHRSASKLASRWLSILSHVAVAPISVAAGMTGIAWAAMQDYNFQFLTAKCFTLALAGVLVAFTSTMLRRLRSVEAGNATPAP